MPKLEICAELSCNHLGQIARAHRIIDAAADAGADLFKVQVWSPDTMCIDQAYTLDSGPWKGRKLFDLYREAWTPWKWLPELFKHCRERGLIPFGAAFDRESVDYLETLGVDRHKVASFELTDLPLIRYMASKGKPMILSTGMATLREIGNALDVVSATMNDCPPIVLQCVSAYPAEAADFNIKQGSRWSDWGLSDHSVGIGVACAAATLGAIYIEKHLTLSRTDGGPDAGFSMEPQEFAQMVTECRRAASAIGEVKYGPGPNESTALRRSLWVALDTAQGEPLRLGVNVVTARPALGLPPSTDLAGKRAARKIKAGTPLTKELIA